MQDVVRRYKETHSDFTHFAEKVVFQLNDTHPTIAVPELMRVLMDENKMGWTEAWTITTKASTYLPMSRFSDMQMASAYSHLATCYNNIRRNLESFCYSISSQAILYEKTPPETTRAACIGSLTFVVDMVSLQPVKEDRS